MHKTQHLGVRVGFQCSFNLFRVNRLAPIIFYGHGCGATAFDVFHHTRAKHTVDADNGLVTRLQQIHKTGFHARGARRRHRQRQFIFGLKGVLQELFGLIHHLDKLGVEMTDSGAAQRFKNARIDIRRPRPHQGTGSGFE